MTAAFETAAPLKVAALTTGKTDPSARFRVRQHLTPLRAMGVTVDEHIPRIDKHSGPPWGLRDRLPQPLAPMIDVAWNAAKLVTRLPGLMATRSVDVAWLNRELLPGRYSMERFLSCPFALDIDDAVWRARPHGAETMARLGRESSLVIAGNRYIAEWFSQHARRIEIVPTAIDTQRFVPPAQRRSDRAWTIGWTGSSGNYQYLYEIEGALDRFLRENNSRLLVMADRPPAFTLLDPARVDFIQWNETLEATALQNMDCGLMPLPDNEWTRGKCSFKMLQYMAVGIPVVVSPVGMNAEVLAGGEVGFGAVDEQSWLDALMALCRDPDLAAEMGGRGRQLVELKYSRDVVAPRLAHCLRLAATS